MNPSAFDYYADKYGDVQRSGLQGWGNSIIDRRVRKLVGVLKDDITVLEIGASSGEHFKYESTEPRTLYLALDLRPGVTNPRLKSCLQESGKVQFIAGDVEKIPLEDSSLDRVLSTCVLHHLNNPEQALVEIDRILKPGGFFILAMPTDPGLFNRFVKTLITYPSMKRAGISSPRYQYAIEHQNHVGGLLEIHAHVFKEYKRIVRYWPLPFLQSWNFNLVVSSIVQKPMS
jgi:ubiquinone/menaquinone biosynthesis C-methylase UbiE